MKRIKVCVATNKIGSTVSRIIEVDDDTTEEEINETVWEVACDMIFVDWEEVEQ